MNKEEAAVYALPEDERYMKLALEEARKAARLGEVPVGALVVRGGEVLAAAHNLREQNRMATAHAELLAIEEACRRLGSWRLADCTLYVTLEPCPMCAGTIINSRLRRVVYGAADQRAGCCGSVANLFHMPFNHAPALTTGVLEPECAALLRDFFETRR